MVSQKHSDPDIRDSGALFEAALFVPRQSIQEVGLRGVIPEAAHWPIPGRHLGPMPMMDWVSTVRSAERKEKTGSQHLFQG